MQSNSVSHSVRCVFLFLALYEFAQLFIIDANGFGLSLFFPAPAFIVALAAYRSLRIIPYIFVAATMASWFSLPPWELGEFNWLQILRQTLVYCIAGYLLRRSTVTLLFSDVHFMWRFLVCAVSSSMVSAALATSLFWWYEFSSVANLPNIFGSFLIGDLSGLLMFAPVAFTLEYYLNERYRLIQMKPHGDFVPLLWAVIAIVLSTAIFAAVIHNQALAQFHYLALLPLVIISARYGAKYALISAISVNLLCAIIYDFAGTTLYSVVEIQVLFTVTALIAMILGSYTDNQQVMHAHLRENQRLLANLAQKSSLSELSSTIAHEVSSPLQAALTNSQVSLHLLKNNQPLDRALLVELNQDIEFALSKAAAIHHRIYRGVKAKDSVQMEKVSVKECLDDATRLLSDTISTQRLELTVNSLLANTMVYVDKLSVTQVFINLIKNAIQANATQVVVETVTCDSQVIIDISNNGDFLAPEIAKNMFHPLFTTKEHGLGLGLSVCRTMLESFSGRIMWVPSDSRSGAQFRITLPKTDYEL